MYRTLPGATLAIPPVRQAGETGYGVMQPRWYRDRNVGCMPPTGAAPVMDQSGPLLDAVECLVGSQINAAVDDGRCCIEHRVVQRRILPDLLH